MPTREQLDEAWAYAREYYRDADVEDSFRLLADYAPDVFVGYMSMRRGAFPIDEHGSRLSPRLHELLILAIEVSALMSPPPTYHAIKAIDAGATPEEVAEVVALCIVLRGMISYQQSGRFALEAAHRRATERVGGEQQLPD